MPDPRVNPPSDPPTLEPELQSVLEQEEECLQRVLTHDIERRGREDDRREVDYDTQLLDLRDEIAASRAEDAPPLLEQMERLQAIATQQRKFTKGTIDPRCPYFGRMVLTEEDRKREVLVGRSTYLDTKSDIRIVDWRDAPVSRLFYRYREGDEYEEEFGGRDVDGVVTVRRSVSIVDQELRRVVSPQGTLIRDRSNTWRAGGNNLKLKGGEGTAARADSLRKPGKLGVGESGDISDDKHLKEITALIDPKQFDVITQPDSGLVVIQGGAGSGKTTIGLHRLAYLAYRDPRRFRPDRMLIVVFNDALARYISQILPALDVEGVAVTTYESLAAEQRKNQLPELPKGYSDETPPAVTRVKKHPALLRALDNYVSALELEFEGRVAGVLEGDDPAALDAARGTWQHGEGRPTVHRLNAFNRWLSDRPREVSRKQRTSLHREVGLFLERAKDVVGAWAEVLGNGPELAKVFEQHSPGELT